MHNWVLAHRIKEDNIAVLSTETHRPDAKFCLTVFAPDGPRYHNEYDDNATDRSWLRIDLRKYRVATKADIQRLDAWIASREWRVGCMRLEYISAWNFFSFHGRSDLWLRLGAAPSLAGCVLLARHLMRSWKE